MPRRFVTTSTFAAGEVSSDYHHRSNIESVQNAAKAGKNIVLNKAGGVESRAPFNNMIPAWLDLPDDSRAIPFKGLDDDWALVYRAAKVGVINGVRVDAVNISQGTHPDINSLDGGSWGSTTATLPYYEAVTPTGADVPLDNAPSYVQIENTLLIASYGSPLVKVTWNESTSVFDIELALFYVEASGVGVRLNNGQAMIEALGDIQYDNTVSPPTKLEVSDPALTRWGGTAGTPAGYYPEFAATDTIRIAGSDFTVLTATDHQSLTLTTNWTGPNVDINYPPAYPLNRGAASEGLIFPRGVALFQGRLVFIADATDDVAPRESRPLSVIFSSTYDPYVLGASIQILGQRPNGPIDIEMRVGTETELMWVTGGDSLVIGGAQGEYSLADPTRAITPTPEGFPAFRKMSNYGSTTESAVLPHDGNLIFSPKGGGRLLSVKYVETNDKFFAGNLAPLSHHLMGSAQSMEISETTSDDPVTRIFLITQDNELRIGSFTDLLEVPGWFPQELGIGVVPHEVIEINNTIYLYVKKGSGNKYTFVKYDLDAKEYCMDFQEDCTGSGPTTTWTYADALTVGATTITGPDLFTVTDRVYKKFYISAGDIDTVSFSQVLTASGGGTGPVHEWGTDHIGDYVILRTPSGTINGTGTLTGTGVSLTYTSQSDTTYTKATQQAESDGSTVTLSYPANECMIGFPYTVYLDPLNIQSQDEIGPTTNRKRRVLSARVRYRDTRNLYVQNVLMLPDQVPPLEAELPERSGVARRTFLGGWRTDDDFRVQSVVPYRLVIDDLTREVAG